LDCVGSEAQIPKVVDCLEINRVSWIISEASTTGNIGPWLRLGTDGSPLVLKDSGTQDIYAMDWEEP
jgi:hypothetical protein